MYKARYYTKDGTKADDRELPIWLFDGIVNESVLHQAVRAYLLNQRQGTASAKSRGEVRGGARKPWRQKGTGRARHGTIRSPIWEGGGVAFPPKPKSWRVDLPRKVKRLARRSAWNARAVDERVILVEDLEFDRPKTRQLREQLEGLELEGKVLLLTDGVKENVHLSGRNLPEVKVLPFGEESAYDILWASTVVIERSALESATEEAEAKGLDEKAKARIARHEARAKAAAEAEKATAGARGKRGKAKATTGEANAAEKAAATPKAEKAEKKEPAKSGAPEKEPAKTKAAEKKQPAKKEPAKAETKKPAAEAVADFEDVELPTVKDLEEFLAGYDDVDAVRALQERDDRKTAQKHYDSRIAELSGEGEGGGDDE